MRWMSLACAAFVFAVCLTARAEEPPKAEQELCKLYRDLKSEDKSTRQTAIREFARFGSRAKPLFGTLSQIAKHDENEDCRASAVYSLSRVIPKTPELVGLLIELLKDEKQADNRFLVSFFLDIGSVGKPAIPHLIQLLDDDYANQAGDRGRGRNFDESFHFGVINALVSIGGDGIPEIAKGLRHERKTVRARTAMALGRIRPRAKEALPALREALKDKADIVRYRAIEAIWTVNHDPKESLPVWTELLMAEDGRIRAAAAWRIGRLGKDAKSAIPALAGLLRDDDYRARWEAGIALAHMGMEAAKAIPALVRTLWDDAFDELGARTNGRADLLSSPALPALLGLGEDAVDALVRGLGVSGKRNTFSEIDDRDRVAQALALFPGSTTIEPLMRTLEAKDEDTRRFAAIALEQVAINHGLPPTAIDAIEKRWMAECEPVQRQLARVLARVRPTNKDILEKFQQMLKGDKGSDRHENFMYIGRMAALNPDARKYLMQVIWGDELEYRRSALCAIADTDLPSATVVETLTEVLGHADQWMRYEAVQGLRRRGSEARSALKVLRMIQSNEPMNTQQEITSAIAVICADESLRTHTVTVRKPRIRPRISRTTKELIDELASERFDERLDAAFGLGSIVPRAKSAVPALRDALKDEHEEIRRTAAESLHRIAPDNTDVLPALLQALVNEEVHPRFMIDPWEERLEAPSRALARMGEPVIPALVELLEDEDLDNFEDFEVTTERGTSMIRIRIIQILAEMGSTAKVAVPALARFLDAKDPELRNVALSALGAIGPSAKDAVASILSQLETANRAKFGVRTWTQIVGNDVNATRQRNTIRIGPLRSPRDHRTAVGFGYRFPPTGLDRFPLRNSADPAFVLGRIGPDAKAAIPILQLTAKDAANPNRVSATAALWRIQGKADEVVPHLLDALKAQMKRRGDRIDGEIVETLGDIGADAREAVDLLTTLLKNGQMDTETRMTAAIALARISEDKADAVAALEAMAQAQDTLSDVRIHAIKAADQFSLGKSKAWIQSLRQWSLEPNDRLLRVAALESLAAEKIKNLDVVEPLRELVGDRDPDVRQAAIEALGRLGSQAKAALPALKTALEDCEPAVRRAAAEAVRQIDE